MRHKSPGYTMLEIIVVVILLLALLRLSIFTYNNSSDKVKLQEAVSVLNALYLAQRNYYLDTGAYTSTIANLEVTIPTLNHFGAPSVYAGKMDNCAGSAAYTILADMTVNSGVYELSVLSDGRIVCCDTSNTYCPRLGFSAW